jgi:expansin (peptidoglycan-binding protein)
MKAEGYRRTIVWVKKDDNRFKYIGTRIHQANLEICKTDNRVKILLATFLELLNEQAVTNEFPWEVYQDISELFKPFGVQP